MKDTERYARLLGLQAPWQVTDVDFSPLQRSVTVFVSPDAGWQWCCPQCGQPAPGYDKRTRQWRHLDTMQFKTLLEAEVPGVVAAPVYRGGRSGPLFVRAYGIS
jgi:transposase